VHHRRALEMGLPPALRWEQATPDERWLARPPAELVEWSIEMSAGRFRMVLDDLAALPAEPGIVVEGIPLLPWLVDAPPSHAIWLVPTPEFARARLLERLPLAGFLETSDPARASESRIAREELFAAAIASSASELGLPVVEVDGSRDLDETTAAVEEHLAPALAALPRATTLEQRAALRSEENSTLLRQLLLHREAHPTVPAAATYGFACECGASGCDAAVELGIDEYDRSRTAVSPGHTRGLQSVPRYGSTVER
jgi:hypothetical protein